MTMKLLPASSTALVLLLAVVGSACATVKSSWVRDDYDLEDRTTTLRLVVVTSPLPIGDESVGKLWSLIARRYVNQKRDFIVKADIAVEEMTDPCSGDLQGVLHLLPSVHLVGDGVEIEVDASLTRCRDGRLIWSAKAGGTWASVDETVRELTNNYVEEFGEVVRPYVAPTFHLLRATLETLPLPRIESDDDLMEKIELGE